MAERRARPVRLGQPVGSLRPALDGELFGESLRVARKDFAVGGAVQQAIGYWRLPMQ